MSERGRVEADGQTEIRSQKALWDEAGDRREAEGASVGTRVPRGDS